MGRMRGCLWLLAGLVMALLAGVVGFMTLSRAAAQRSANEGATPEVPVVVAAQAIPIRAALKPSDLTMRNLPVNAVPEGALRDVSEAVGKVVLTELYAGEIVLRQRLVDPNLRTGDGRFALALTDDQVLLAYPASDLLSRSGVLKAGDRVDLLFSVEVDPDRSLSAVGARPAGGSGTEVTTFSSLHNVTISAVVAGQVGNEESAAAPQMLLLTLSPQDALTLKYLKDINGVLDMVLRAPGAEQPYVTDPVDADYLIRRYRLPVEIGR